MRLFIVLLLTVFFEMLPSSIVLAATTADKQLKIVHDQLTIKFRPRTSEQMGSFYEARGFPKAMRNIIREQCFITVNIKNISKKKIWLDLSDWQFSVNGKPIKREHRDQWKQRWQDMGIPLRFQSTFRWTLIPETLDYLPGEREGGNIVLPFTRGKITLDAKFKTGEDKKGKVIHIHYDQLYCAGD